MRGLIALEGGLRQALPFKALQCNWKVNRLYLYRNIILKKRSRPCLDCLTQRSNVDVHTLRFLFFFLLVYPLCSAAATSPPCLFFVAYAPNWEHYSWRLDINLAASCNIECGWRERERWERWGYNFSVLIKSTRATCMWPRTLPLLPGVKNE